MPGDTKIKKEARGWYDVDQPNVFHSARWQARAARRGATTARATAPTTRNNTSIPSQIASIPRPTFSQPVVGTQNFIAQSLAAPTSQATTSSVRLSPLTSLQQRLVDRLTTRQGVSLPEALVVVNSHGYNAAASYGHMREAGATHAEAVSVIDRGDPDASLVYGKARAAGHDHASALRLADAGVTV